MLTLGIVALWFAAMLEIVLHRGDETFTNVKSLCMTALVSVVAATAVASTGAVFAGQWPETLARANYSEEVQADKQESAHAYLFSFGLEHASSIKPAKSTSKEKQVILDGHR